MKNIIYLLLLPILCFLSGCKGNSEDVSRLMAERDSLQESSRRNQQDLENLNMFVNELSLGLDSIAVQEGYILNSRENGVKMTRAEMKERLKELSSIVSRHRSRIAILEDSLKSKGTDIGKIHSIVNYLNEQLEAKEKTIKSLQAELNNSRSDIAKLQSKVSALNQNIEELGQQNQIQQQALQEQSNMLNEGYVKIATKKELKKAGIIKGGFFSAKKLDPSALNSANFSRIDISKVTEIVIPSKKPKILTTMPSSSYTLTNNNNGTTTLNIVNPTLFWSSSSYLVISTD